MEKWDKAGSIHFPEPSHGGGYRIESHYCCIDATLFKQICPSFTVM